MQVSARDIVMFGSGGRGLTKRETRAQTPFQYGLASWGIVANAGVLALFQYFKFLNENPAALAAFLEDSALHILHSLLNRPTQSEGELGLV